MGSVGKWGQPPFIMIRYHTAKGIIGNGHLYQGRYKSFICQKNNYLLALLRYVERNAKRAKLVQKAEN